MTFGLVFLSSSIILFFKFLLESFLEIQRIVVKDNTSPPDENRMVHLSEQEKKMETD